MNAKYKDLTPQETIKKAKSVLSKIGLNMHETILHPTTNLYSIHLQDDTICWGVNGKGVSEEYCAASAYGEAMERLQNLHIPFFEHGDVNENEGYKYYPDEEDMRISKSDIPYDVYVDMQHSYFDAEGHIPTDNELFQIWQEWQEKDTCKALPFYSVRDNEVVRLPFEIIRRLCRSNGLAAGNSIEEAICQAISEILERFSLEQIISNQLTPPVIPTEYIKKQYHEQYEIIKQIEAKQLSVLVLDGSLGKQLPVICLLVVDNVNQSYRFKVGCHPTLGIALERCLTEFAQGDELTPESRKRTFIPWNKTSQDQWDSLYNWSKNFRSNSGSIPNAVFLQNNSWDFDDWNYCGDFNNKTGARLLMDKCLELSDNVYIRDNSFLGFPAVRVYVPKITLVHKFNPLAPSTLISKRVRNIIEDFPYYCTILNKNDKETLVRIFSTDYHAMYEEHLGVAVQLLLGALYLDLGFINKAVEALHKVSNKTIYIKAAIRELEMLNDGVQQQDRDRMLNLFFGNKVTAYIHTNWRGDDVTSGLFDPYRLNALRKITNNKKVGAEYKWHKIIANMRSIMSSTIINQRNISSLLII